MDSAELAGLIADPRRRKVVACLVLGTTTVDDIVDVTGLRAADVMTALAKLVAGGLVVQGDGRSWRVVDEAFIEAARRARETNEEPATDEPDKVLRAFVRGGRLTAIPTQHSKRLVVLNRLAQEFEPGVRYSEADVNATLRAWHDDTAALRRYLVDDEFLSRDHGVYWRSGGSYPVTGDTG